MATHPEKFKPSSKFNPDTGDNTVLDKRFGGGDGGCEEDRSPGGMGSCTISCLY